MRKFVFAAILGIAGLGFVGAETASAHPPGGVPAGFGNGAHDLQPHLHRTNTLFGPVYWYGNGRHDLRPHNHSVSPWGGVRSYNITPFGPTTSYNGFPSYRGYRPFFGGYSGWGW